MKKKIPFTPGWLWKEPKAISPLKGVPKGRVSPMGIYFQDTMYKSCVDRKRGGCSSCPRRSWTVGGMTLEEEDPGSRHLIRVEVHPFGGLSSLVGVLIWASMIQVYRAYVLFCFFICFFSCLSGLLPAKAPMSVP